MSDGEGTAFQARDITDPHEILLAEVAAAREQLRLLIEQMKTERFEWDRLIALQRSRRLTAEHKQRLRSKRPRPK
jgi:hypothetical protein